MKFDIHPYERAGCICIGTKRSELHDILGEPEHSRSMRSGEIADTWPDFIIRYDKESESVVEIELKETAVVEYRGIDVFGDSSALSKLLKLDGCPLEGTGTVILLNLGLSTWNLESLGSPRSVCVFCRGRWDDILDRLKPYGMNIRANQ